jgi:hypothetical protein
MPLYKINFVMDLCYNIYVNVMRNIKSLYLFIFFFLIKLFLIYIF